MTRKWNCIDRLYFVIVLVWCLSLSSTFADGYFDWKYVLPAANSTAASLPRINIGMSMSMNAVSGTQAQQAVQLAVQRANARGGVMFNGTKHAVTLTWLSDESSTDLTYYLYTLLSANSSIHQLVASYGTSQTIAEIAAVKKKNGFIWSTGSSSNTVFTGTYPYVFGAVTMADTWFNYPLDIIMRAYDIKSVALVVRTGDVFNAGIGQTVTQRMNSTGIPIVFYQAIPTTATSTNGNLEDFYYQTFSDPSFPQTVDLLVLVSTSVDLAYAARALKTSQRAPKLAVFNQYVTETTQSTIDDAEGWMTCYSYRYDSYSRKANIPGVLFEDGNDFNSAWNQTYGVQPAPPSAQTMASIEGMFATLNVATSFDSAEIRRAALSLDGNTFFSRLKYDPTYNHNPSQQLIPYQVINGIVTRIDTSDQITVPYPWSWTIKPVFTRSSAQTTLMALLLIVAFFALCCALALATLRKTRVFHSASPTMLAWVILGAACIIVAGILNVQAPTVATCTANFWLFNIGFTMALGALCLKTYRLHKIFNSGKLQVTVLTDNMLVQILISLLLIDLVLLAVRTGVAPYPSTFMEDKCRVSSDLSSSAAAASTAILWLLLAWKAILLVAGAFLCFYTRKVPSMYAEASFLSVGTYTLSIISLVYLVITQAFSFNSNPASLRVFESACMLVGTLVVLGLIFVPKFILVVQLNEVHKKPRGTGSRQLNQSKLSSIDGSSSSLSKKDSSGVGRAAIASVGLHQGVIDALTQLNSMLLTCMENLYHELTNQRLKIGEKKEDIRRTGRKIAETIDEKAYVESREASQWTIDELQAILANAQQSMDAISLKSVSTPLAKKSGPMTRGPSLASSHGLSPSTLRNGSIAARSGSAGSRALVPYPIARKPDDFGRFSPIGSPTAAVRSSEFTSQAFLAPPRVESPTIKSETFTNRSFASTPMPEQAARHTRPGGMRLHVHVSDNNMLNLLQQVLGDVPASTTIDVQNHVAAADAPESRSHQLSATSSDARESALPPMIEASEVNVASHLAESFSVEHEERTSIESQGADQV